MVPTPLSTQPDHSQNPGTLRPAPFWREWTEGTYWRLAASGRRKFPLQLPADEMRSPPPGDGSLEIVSHCWQYSHLLAYQLSSLVLHPPQRCQVRMSVCYSPEDQLTTAWLRFFESISIPTVTWNWIPLHPRQLFRRAIGRNLAARQSTSSWIWFTDCDVVFGANCLDTLGDLLPRQNAPLLFPSEERRSTLLQSHHSILRHSGTSSVLDLDTSSFVPHQPPCATGPLQIMRGDLARKYGYCNQIRLYQTPARHWRKTYEDRVLRWLLGTQGHAIECPGIYRIRHIEKGRYPQMKSLRSFRSWIRSMQHRKMPAVGK